VDQRAAGAAIAVDEWVDGLELCVSHGGLGDGGQRVLVAEGAEITHELSHELMWWGDECGGAGVEAAASYPVLALAELSRVALQAGAGEEAFVYREDVLDGDLRSLAECFDRPVHRLDVVEDLRCRDVLATVLEPSREICLEQAAPADLETLDPGGRDGFGPQQETRHGFRVGERAGLPIQARDRERLGLAGARPSRSRCRAPRRA
jgi:hypothetical protein